MHLTTARHLRPATTFAAGAIIGVLWLQAAQRLLAFVLIVTTAAPPVAHPALQADSAVVLPFVVASLGLVASAILCATRCRTTFTSACVADTHVVLILAAGMLHDLALFRMENWERYAWFAFMLVVAAEVTMYDPGKRWTILRLRTRHTSQM